MGRPVIGGRRKGAKVSAIAVKGSRLLGSLSAVTVWPCVLMTRKGRIPIVLQSDRGSSSPVALSSHAMPGSSQSDRKTVSGDCQGSLRIIGLISGAPSRRSRGNRLQPRADGQLALAVEAAEDPV